MIILLDSSRHTYFTLFHLKIFNGNDGRNDTVKHNLVEIARARFVRFQPTEFSTRKALRVELYGVRDPTGNALTFDTNSFT